MGRRPTSMVSSATCGSSIESVIFRNPPRPTLMQPHTFASMHRCSCRTIGIHCHCCRPRARWSPPAPSSCTARRSLATLSLMARTRWRHSSMADTAQVSCNGLASCSCTVPHCGRRARCNLTKSSSWATIVCSRMLAMHQHHTADCAVCRSYHAPTAQQAVERPSLALRQACTELGSR